MATSITLIEAARLVLVKFFAMTCARPPDFEMARIALEALRLEMDQDSDDAHSK